MHPQLPILIDLQTIDLRILEIKDQERKLPALLQASESPLLKKPDEPALKFSPANWKVSIKIAGNGNETLETHEAQVGKT